MTNIGELATRLQEYTSWQRTPVALSYSDYCNMIVYGIRDLYIMTGRATSYSEDMINYGPSGFPETFQGDMYVDEEEFVLVSAQMYFFQRVQTDVNNIVGYTTDALTITNADKPYVNIQTTLQDLYDRRSMLLYKMVRYMEL